MRADVRRHGLYITLGDPLHTPQSERYYCPVRSPRFAKW